MVGQYAKVRMIEGSLLAADSVQARPLVDPSKVLMSIAVPASGVPIGLREGSRLLLIVTAPSTGGGTGTELVDATVAAVPRDLGDVVSSGGSTSSVALSVEVAPEAAPVVGSADAIAVAVVPPETSGAGG
jgi:hypothetical protein